jgi:hypothetical protein
MRTWARGSRGGRDGCGYLDLQNAWLIVHGQLEYGIIRRIRISVRLAAFSSTRAARAFMENLHRKFRRICSCILRHNLFRNFLFLDKAWHVPAIVRT